MVTIVLLAADVGNGKLAVARLARGHATKEEADLKGTVLEGHLLPEAQSERFPWGLRRDEQCHAPVSEPLAKCLTNVAIEVCHFAAADALPVWQVGYEQPRGGRRNQRLKGAA